MSAVDIHPAGQASNFDLIQTWIESLSSKMDKLINIQQKVLSRLDGMSQDIDDIENDMENLKVDKEEIHLSPRLVNQTPVTGGEVREICQEMSTIMSVVNQRSELQAQKLEGMEKLVLSMQQVIGFIGETVKKSKVMELMFKGPAARKGSRHKDNKGKQAIKRKSSADTINRKLEKVRLRTCDNLLCIYTGGKGEEAVFEFCTLWNLYLIFERVHMLRRLRTLPAIAAHPSSLTSTILILSVLQKMLYITRADFVFIGAVLGITRENDHGSKTGDSNASSG